MFLREIAETIIAWNGNTEELTQLFGTEDYSEMICWATNHAYEDLTDFEPEAVSDHREVLKHFINNWLMYNIQCGKINTRESAILMHYSKQLN